MKRPEWLVPALLVAVTMLNLGCDHSTEPHWDRHCADFRAAYYLPVVVGKITVMQPQYMCFRHDSTWHDGRSR